MRTVPVCSALLVLILCPCVGADDERKAGDPQVVLIEAGAEPRAPLRYSPSAKTTCTLQLAISEQALPARGQPPAMVFDFQLIVDRVSAGAEIGARLLLRGFQPGRPDGVLGSGPRRARFERVEGTSMEVRTDGRGGSRSVHTTLRDYLPKRGMAAVTSMGEALPQWLHALPEAPVGVGAKWRVTMTATDAGRLIQRTMTYTLEKRKGREVALSIVIKELAEPQDMPQRGVRLIEYTGEGTGMMTLDLNALAPTHSEITTTLRSKYSIRDRTREVEKVQKLVLKRGVPEPLRAEAPSPAFTPPTAKASLKFAMAFWGHLTRGDSSAVSGAFHLPAIIRAVHGADLDTLSAEQRSELIRMYRDLYTRSLIGFERLAAKLKSADVTFSTYEARAPIGNHLAVDCAATGTKRRDTGTYTLILARTPEGLRIVDAFWPDGDSLIIMSRTGYLVDGRGDPLQHVGKQVTGWQKRQEK